MDGRIDGYDAATVRGYHACILAARNVQAEPAIVNVAHRPITRSARYIQY